MATSGLSNNNTDAKLTVPRIHLLADLLLLLVAIAWGSSYVTAKSVVSAYPVFLFLFLRFVLTVVVMLPFVWRKLRHASADTWKAGLVFGAFLFTIYSLETVGVALTTASNTGFLISLCVVLCPLTEGMILGRRPGWLLMAAVLLSFIGTGFLTLREGYEFNLGDLLVLGAALMRAVQMTYTEKLTAGKDYDSGALTIIQLGVVAVLTGCTAWLTLPSAEFVIPTDANFWWITLYLAVVCTIFAFYVQMKMIRLTSPTRVGLLMGTEPLFAALFAVMIGGETLGWQGIVGGSLIVFATYWGRHLESKRSMQT